MTRWARQKEDNRKVVYTIRGVKGRWNYSLLRKQERYKRGTKSHAESVRGAEKYFGKDSSLQGREQGGFGGGDGRGYLATDLETLSPENQTRYWIGGGQPRGDVLSVRGR